MLGQTMSPASRNSGNGGWVGGTLNDSDRIDRRYYTVPEYQTNQAEIEAIRAEVAAVLSGISQDTLAVLAMRAEAALNFGDYDQGGNARIYGDEILAGVPGIGPVVDALEPRMAAAADWIGDLTSNNRNN